ncbi:unnamed protein product, partial [marine sediment metagenome]
METVAIICDIESVRHMAMVEANDSGIDVLIG